MDCKNCHNTLKDTQKFCDECGAKVIQNRLTPKSLAKQVNEEFWTIDNKFFKTFVDLFTKPEVVINGYINGTRKKYVNVIQYFAISLTLAGIQAFLMTTFFKGALESDMSILTGLENLPGQEDNPFLNMDFESQSKYQSFIYIVSVPISAIATWLAYYIVGERRFNFTEHIIINLYYSAQIVIISAIVTILFLAFNLNFLIAALIITIPIYLYFFYVLKRVFKNTFWDTVLKFILVIIIMSLILLIAFILGVIAVIIYLKLTQ